MNLANQPPRYDQAHENRRNDELGRADRQNRKNNADVEVPNPQRLILQSPNGSRWSITISNTGVITAVAA